MKEGIVITIGRENGSGGKYIGEKLAEKLGIKCYDENLVTETAKKYNIDAKKIQKNDEMPPVSILYFGGQPIPQKVFDEEADVIKKIAESESCIFIGRASNYVLRKLPNVINVFIHAPLESRVERYSRRNNISKEKAKKQIQEQDKKRSEFYKFYTNEKWGEAQNYNLSIDTSKVGIDGAISLIESYISLKNENNKNNKNNKII